MKKRPRRENIKMYPKYHIILGFIFTIIIYLFFPSINFMYLTIIFLSSFLIDLDHYLFYVYSKKDFNLKNAYKWFDNHSKKFKSMNLSQRNYHYVQLFFFHGIEILLILLILGFMVSQIFLLIFAGFVFHLTLDLIHQLFYGYRIDKMSIIYDYFKYKKLVRID